MKVAYVFSATGEDYIRMMRYSEHCLRRFVPDAEVFEIDETLIRKFYNGGDATYYAHLAIPLDERFVNYDKVLFLDADCEVVNEKFATIFAFGDKYEITGRPCSKFVNPKCGPWEVNTDRPQLNGGCVLYNMALINREEWAEKMRGLSEFCEHNSIASRDEGWMYFMSEPCTIPNLYNNEGYGESYMVHHRHDKKAYIARARAFEEGCNCGIVEVK